MIKVWCDQIYGTSLHFFTVYIVGNFVLKMLMLYSVYSSQTITCPATEEIKYKNWVKRRK